MPMFKPISENEAKGKVKEIFEDIKRNLSRGVKDRKHDFHTPVFSNINNQSIFICNKSIPIFGIDIFTHLRVGIDWWITYSDNFFFFSFSLISYPSVVLCNVIFGEAGRGLDSIFLINAANIKLSSYKPKSIINKWPY